MASNRTYVTPPTFTAAPFGLLSSMAGEIRSPSDRHWQLGITYESLCGAGGTTYEKCLTVTGSGLAPAGNPVALASTVTLQQRGATPFTVFAEVDCSPTGFWNNAARYVGDALTESEQWQAERALWTGLAGGQPVVYPHLAANAQVLDGSIVLQTAATTVTGTGVIMDVVEGIGLLESQLADCYDGVAVLHVPVVLAAAMADANMLVRDGARYRTVLGNIVVFGGGYRGTAPDGTSALGSTWVYATGAMTIYRSRANVLPLRTTLDRAENNTRAIAERTYVIGWECCHLAVRISTGGRITGTALSAT